MTATTVRLASLPLPPRAAPVRRPKRISHGGAIRPFVIDKQIAGKVVGDGDSLPRISSMPLECPVLVVGAGVPAFKVEHIGAALQARGVRGYWSIELQSRPRVAGAGALAQTLVGFPGLHIERIGSASDL